MSIHRNRRPRHSQIETLEDRVVMSADPLGGLLGGAVSHHAIIEDAPPALSHHESLEQHGDLISREMPAPDFWIDRIEPTLDLLEDGLNQIEKTLTQAHEQTGLNDVRANYGFRGGGQTVAVIDSGIAWDHNALGGGFGSSYRVVGGWDFTENDADPYDDGAEGSHGTHVAGIVGSDDSTHTGVAPDVDLVGLRVFNDAGAGYFHWVEDALQWVIANRTAHDNPITAVNLSLGTNWNSDTIPGWTMIEDEFQQLEQLGVFVAVSAGNSFQSYNEAGLSYPAASPHVVPVMSTDDSGNLSYFSQRHESAIAAPGRWIYSTVPDYAGNNNGVTDDWANFSGTSMAAPYVAGASVLVREAMEFVGQTNITQDDIYDHMRATADSLFDSATNASYLRLNLGNAIDALMPADDFGSSEIDAYNLGTITGQVSGFGGLSTHDTLDLNGAITKLDDADYFTFTAGSTGTVTFNAANTTHNLESAWEGLGGEGWTIGEGEGYTMNVVAGQQYTVALSSVGGLGYYDLSITAEASFDYIDWGAIAPQQTVANQTAGVAQWYRVQAGQTGFLSIEALSDAGFVDIDLYDTALGLVDDAAGNRADVYAGAGDEFFLRVEGDAADVDFRLTNAVTLVDSTVTVTGTSSADDLSFTAGETMHGVSLNGVIYTFAASEYDNYVLQGGGGEDTAILRGTAADETAVVRDQWSRLAGGGYTTTGVGFESMTIIGNGGHDSARMYDSAGDDRYAGREAYSRIDAVDGSYTGVLTGFAEMRAYASAGDDEAFLYDTPGDDRLAGRGDYSALWSEDGDHYNLTRGFDTTRAYASSGHDAASLFDSSSDDIYVSREDYADMDRGGGGSYTLARGFDETRGYATVGNDLAFVYDTAGDDTLLMRSSFSVMQSTDGQHFNLSKGFDQTRAYASTGFDRAFMYDSAGNDVFLGRSDYSVMESATGAAYYNLARGFDDVRAYASTGNDAAVLEDSTGDDRLVTAQQYSVLRAVDQSFLNLARGFDSVTARQSEGNDTHVVTSEDLDYALAEVGDWELI